jgi:hypothetical protein
MRLLLVFTSLLLTAFASGQDKTARYECKDLGIYFMLPKGFAPINQEQMQALDERGKKAVKEEFNKEEYLGWQTSCLNLMDSLKRPVIVSVITEKEAVKQNGSTEAFILETFRQMDEFMIARIKRKMNPEEKLVDMARQSQLKIAGYTVYKNAFTWKQGNLILLAARYYFIKKDENLYLISFTGNLRAHDNEAVEKAIESASRL